MTTNSAPHEVAVDAHHLATGILLKTGDHGLAHLATVGVA